MLYNMYFVMPFITGDSSDWLIEVIFIGIPFIGFEVHVTSPVILVVGIYILVFLG